MKAQWQRKKKAIDAIRDLKEQIEQAQSRSSNSAERDGDLTRRAELRYGALPQLERNVEAARSSSLEQCRRATRC